MHAFTIIKFDCRGITGVFGYAEQENQVEGDTAKHAKRSKDALARRLVASWLLTQKANCLQIENERVGAILHV